MTGATGFVGTALCEKIKKSGHALMVLARETSTIDPDIPAIQCELDEVTKYQQLMKKVDVVIHLAGRAHILKETESDGYEAFAAVNIRGTEKLVTTAARCGVKRFIYMSTTKVCGERTRDVPFNELSPIDPQDDYAKTKAIAESLVQQTCSNSKMEYVIIRPPLVYGPNVKANFKRLVSISRSILPIPLGAVPNRRSMVYLGNLVDFVEHCVAHPHAANQVFFVSDDDDISTPQLLRKLAKSQQRKLLLPNVPPTLLKVVFNFLSPGLYTKLCENLQVDVTKAKNRLNWKPAFSVEDGLRNTVKMS